MTARLDEAYVPTDRIQYFPTADEIEVFKTAAEQKLAVMLKGPTGCGKTRFVEYMAQELKRPLVTIPCHEDLTASDLVGRYLLKGGETVWEDGTSRFLPSDRVTLYHLLILSSSAGFLLTKVNFALPSSSSTPLHRRLIIGWSTSPKTRTEYSRSIS